MRVSEPFYRALLYCHRWGVEVRLGEQVTDRDRMLGRFFGAPQHAAGIVWPDPIIYWFDRAHDRRAANALLHELAHCLVGTNPIITNEVDGPLLAIEFASARYLRFGGRSEWMRNYGIDTRGSWNKLSNHEKHEVLKLSLRKAVWKGLLTTTCRPTFKR